MDTDYVIGIDWGGTRIKLGAVTRSARLLHESVYDSPKPDDIDTATDELAGRVKQLISRIGREPVGIGIGLTGPVDPALGVVYLPGKIKGLEKYPIVPKFQQCFGVPVRAGNDGILSMYAEKHAGRARIVKWAVTVTIGTGIGSGVMLDGQILADPRFMFGCQLGHLVMDVGNDQLCLTGARGTGEMICSATALALAVRSGLQRGIPSILTERYQTDAHAIDFRTVMEDGVRLGDKLCCDELRRWTRNLGWLLVNAVHAYSPEIIILSGGATRAAEFFLADVQRHVDEHIFRYPPRVQVPVVLSGLVEQSGVVGAAMMLFEHLSVLPAKGPEGPLPLSGITMNQSCA